MATKIVIQQINTIDSGSVNVGKYPRYVVRLGNSISSITAAELSTAVTAAQNSATAAAGSATAAKTSETNAKTSETNAKTSETNAATSRTQAAASAAAALVSQNAAKTSETNAASAAAAALISQNAAKTSETNAKTSETNAKTSETNAATSRTNAAASATAALASQNAAKTSETNAKTSETNAKTSETNAKTSETNAAQSASDAAAVVVNAVQVKPGNLSDCNLATTVGIYSTTASTLNAPVATGGILQVYVHVSPGNYIQELNTTTATASLANRKFMRMYNGTTWSAWTEIFTAKSYGYDFGVISATPTSTTVTAGTLTDPAILNLGNSILTLSGTYTDAPVGYTSAAIAGQLRTSRRVFAAGAAIVQELWMAAGVSYLRTGSANAAFTTFTWNGIASSGDSNGWRRVYDEAQKPTAAEVNAVGYKGNIGSVDLNTLGPQTSSGVWNQSTSAPATLANNYPEANAVGFLEVLPYGQFNGTQRYTIRTGNIYVRSLTAVWNGTNGPWSPWVRTAALNSVDVPLNSLTTENLNTLGGAINSDKTTIYYQTANARATADNNYPEGFAGTLFVTPSAYGYQQRYESIRGNVYYRALTGAWNGVDGPWQAWSGLPTYGYGLPAMPNQTAFDWQQFDWVSGGRYYAPNTIITNMPAGITYAAGTGVTVVVDQLTASGTRATLTVIPDSAADSNFRVYKVLSVGAKGSRVFTVRQELSSADTTLTLAQSPGDTTLVPGSGGVGATLQSAALRVSGSAASAQNTFAIQGYSFSTADFGSNIVGTRSAGSQGVHGALPTNRSVLTIQGAASDGVQYRQLGRMDFYTSENTTPTSWSGELRIYTTPTGNTGPALAMTIDNTQNVIVGKSVTVGGVMTTREETITYRQLLSRTDAFSPYTGYNRIDQVEGTAPTAITGIGDITARLTTTTGDPWGRVLGGLSLQHNLDNGGRVVLSARNVSAGITSAITMDGGAATVAVTGLLQTANSSATGLVERAGTGTLGFNNSRTNAAVNSYYGAQTTAGQVFFGTGSGTNFVINNAQNNTGAWATIDAANAAFSGQLKGAKGLELGSANTSTTGIELGSLTTAAVCFIDFHSSGTANDYDVRLIASGGTTASGGGALTINATSSTFTGSMVSTTVLSSLGRIDLNGSNDPNATQGYISFNNAAGTQYSAFYSERAGDTTLMVDAHGNPKYFQFAKTGNFIASGTVTCSSVIQTSDRDKKTDIINIPNALDKVNSINGVTFNWKDSGLPSAGIIAQELKEVLPECISTVYDNGEGRNDEGILEEGLASLTHRSYAVEYSGVIALAIEAIKELSSKVDSLEAELAELKSK